jgi:hypothetical protein
MTIELINLGQYANDGTGDDLRTAFEKVNSNFTTLNLTLGVTNGTNVGSGSQLFKAKVSDTLQFRTLRSPNGSVSVVSTDNTVDLSVTTELSTDLTPVLGGDLNLNGNIIYNGDAQTTVYGYSVPLTSGLLELILAGNTYTIDFGSFLDPTGGGNGGIDLDFGEIGFDSFANGIDFGTISVPSGVSGGGGTSGAELPGDAPGYLYNDGNGTLTWNPITEQLSKTSTIVAGVLNLDFNYVWHTVTLNQNVTEIQFSNIPPVGSVGNITVEFIQNGTGNFTVNNTSDFLTAGNLGLDIMADPNSISIVSFVTGNGGSRIYAFNGGKDFS